MSSDMDRDYIRAQRERFDAFVRSDEMALEIFVGDDPSRKQKIPFAVLLPGIHRPLFFFRHVIARIVQFIDYSPAKILIYRLIGFRIGKGVYISPDVILDAQFPSFIEIGDHAVLGWGSKIFVHDYDGVVFRVGRVKIGAGSVIGGFSFIRAGTTIPEQSLVKLGSTIFRDGDRNILPIPEVRKRRERWATTSDQSI